MSIRFRFMSQVSNFHPHVTQKKVESWELSYCMMAFLLNGWIMFINFAENLHFPSLYTDFVQSILFYFGVLGDFDNGVLVVKGILG